MSSIRPTPLPPEPVVISRAAHGRPDVVDWDGHRFCHEDLVTAMGDLYLRQRLDTVRLTHRVNDLLRAGNAQVDEVRSLRRQLEEAERRIRHLERAPRTMRPR